MPIGARNGAFDWKGVRMQSVLRLEESRCDRMGYADDGHVTGIPLGKVWTELVEKS